MPFPFSSGGRVVSIIYNTNVLPDGMRRLAVTYKNTITYPFFAYGPTPESSTVWAAWRFPGRSTASTIRRNVVSPHYRALSSRVSFAAIDRKSRDVRWQQINRDRISSTVQVLELTSPTAAHFEIRKFTRAFPKCLSLPYVLQLLQ